MLFDNHDAQQPLFDEEAGGLYEPNEKVQRRLRHDFMRKVYGIVLVQLLGTSGICYYATQNAQFADYLAQPWVLMLGAIVSVVCQLVIVCTPAGVMFPMNYGILAVFTAFFSLSAGCLVGVVSNRVKGGNMMILQALLVTAVMVVGLTAFAMQTTYDFVSFTGILCIAGFAILGASLLRMMFPNVRTLNIAIAAASALLMAAYLVVDTQLLKNRLGEDSYIAAAMMLYVDIVSLFINILQVIMYSSRDD